MEGAETVECGEDGEDWEKGPDEQKDALPLDQVAEKEKIR